jgi:hypothetical protein
MNLWDKFIKNRKLIITTCVDPEDLISICLLKDSILEYTKTKILYFIVGENNSLKKYFMLLKFLESVNIPNNNIKITKGFNSNNIFENEGTNVLSVPILNIATKALLYKNTFDSSEFINDFDSIAIISLKPMKELYYLYNQNNYIFKNTILFGYMGYNILNIKESFLKSFEKVYYYDKYNITPNFQYSLIDINVLNNLSIVEYVKIWNKSMFDKYYNKFNNIIEIENGSEQDIMANDIDNLDIDTDTKKKIKRYLQYLHYCKNPLNFRNSDCALIYQIFNKDYNKYIFKKGSIYYFQLALICQRYSTHDLAVASTCAPHWVEDTEKVL